MLEHPQVYGMWPRIQYVSNGKDSRFVYNYIIFHDSDIEVYIGDERLTSGYTVTGVKNDSGGEIVFDTPPGADQTITLIRNLPIQRLSDFQESASLRAKVLNDEFDYLTAAVQQVAVKADRSITLGATDADASLTLPPKDVRSNQLLGFDDQGNVITSDPVPVTALAGVQSVFGRTGSINATAGDYNAGQIAETSQRIFFTPAQREKLSAIEPNATSDMSGSEIAAAITAEFGSNVWRSGGTGAVSWGGILGNIGDQADLSEELTAFTEAVDAVQRNLDSHALSRSGHPLATTDGDGLMSADDKTKLEGIDPGATAGGTTPMTTVNATGSTAIAAPSWAYMTGGASTYTHTLPAADGTNDQHVVYKLGTTAAQTFTVNGADTSSSLNTDAPGTTNPTSLLIEPGSRVFFDRQAGEDNWLVDIVPPFDALTHSYVMPGLAFSEYVYPSGTMAAFAPAWANGEHQAFAFTATGALAFMTGTPPNDICAVRTLRLVNSTGGAAAITLDSSYGVLGVQPDLYFAADAEQKLLSIVHLGGVVYVVGFIPPQYRDISSAFTAPPTSGQYRIASGGAIVLPQSTTLTGLTVIVIFNDSGGSVTPTLTGGETCDNGGAIPNGDTVVVWSSPGKGKWEQVVSLAPPVDYVPPVDPPSPSDIPGDQNFPADLSSGHTWTPVKMWEFDGAENDPPPVPWKTGVMWAAAHPQLGGHVWRDAVNLDGIATLDGAGSLRFPVVWDNTYKKVKAPYLITYPDNGSAPAETDYKAQATVKGIFLEARIKLPPQPTLAFPSPCWFAWWLYNAQAPGGNPKSELDIMEYFATNSWTRGGYTTNTHGGANPSGPYHGNAEQNGPYGSGQFNFPNASGPTGWGGAPVRDGQFHTYSMFWSTTEQRFYYDGFLFWTRTHNGSTVLVHQDALDLRLTIEASYNGACDKTLQASYNAGEFVAANTVYVDYVRVFERAAA